MPDSSPSRVGAPRTEPEPTAAVDGAFAHRFERLRERLRGDLLLPGDPGFDDRRRVWNAAIDLHPAAVVRCLGVEDVVEAVRAARDAGVSIGVRGGGHNVAGKGTCEGGLLVDLSDLRSVSVDPDGRTARAQGGARWSDLDAATQAHGLAVTGGAVSTTGIGGLTLGGGVGWLARRHGLTCDNLVGGQVVTADGRIVPATPRENPDLFWGLTGGGGNFGVVTAFDYRLHPVGPTVLGGPIVHPLERAAGFLRRYREVADSAPDEVTCEAILRTAAQAGEMRGRPVVAVMACHSGPIEDGERALAPLRSSGRPAVDDLVPRPYRELQSMLDGAWPFGLATTLRSHYVNHLSDELIDTLVDHVRRAAEDGVPLGHVGVFQMGGVIRALPPDDTAFGGRGAGHVLNVSARWPAGTDPGPHRGFVRGLWEALRPFATGGVYVNYVGDGEDRVLPAYGRYRYDRLAEVKAAYDPDNVFRFNQNIRPEGDA